MVTPLGDDPREVLRRIEAGDSAAAPTGFEPGLFACPVCARVMEFAPQRYVTEAKMLRLMNRDAQLAVAAARLALADAGVRRSEEIDVPGMAQGFWPLARRERGAYPDGSVTSEQRLVAPKLLSEGGSQWAKDPARPGTDISSERLKAGATYQPDEIALFGATGMAGLPLREVAPLLRVSVGPEGRFDMERFGQAGLKAVSPILSFKILSNMPFCFVSINEGIEGVNGIYAPWEGQGAQAVEAGVRALLAGDARCALVGGCDVKTHELAFASLEQQGLFKSRPAAGAPSLGAPASLPACSVKDKQAGRGAGAPGMVPGEGAAFLVLETAKAARARGARIYAGIRSYALRSHHSGTELSRTWSEVLGQLDFAGRLGVIVSSANGEDWREREERRALEAVRISANKALYPKQHAGDLFAAAGVLQIGLGALAARQCGQPALANCFGHGSEQASFILELA